MMSALTMLKRRARTVLAALAAILLLAVPALAMRVSPMVLEMESRGSAAVARMEVQNINTGTLAFQTRVYRMNYEPNGEITETPADEDFLIFPPQGVLPAGGRQVIRLQWVGDPDIATSQAYYVAVEQLPVALDPTTEEGVGAKLQVLYNMRALVVVAPPGAQPNITATDAHQVDYQLPPAPGSTEKGPMQDGVAVTLTNSGRRHAMMSDLTWQIEGTDREGQYLRVDLSPEELSRIVGSGYTPAQGRRTFNLPIPGFGPGPIKVLFKK